MRVSKKISAENHSVKIMQKKKISYEKVEVATFVKVQLNEGVEACQRASVGG